MYLNVSFTKYQRIRMQMKLLYNIFRTVIRRRQLLDENRTSQSLTSNLCRRAKDAGTQSSNENRLSLVHGHSVFINKINVHWFIILNIDSISIIDTGFNQIIVMSGINNEYFIGHVANSAFGFRRNWKFNEFFFYCGHYWVGY